MRKSRFAAAAAALAVVATGGALTLNSSPAEAMPSDAHICTLEQLDINTAELASPNTDRLYAINFNAKPGVTCDMYGTPGKLTFYKGANALPMPVEPDAPDETAPVTVDEAHPAVVYLTGPRTEGPAMASKISFDLPGNAVNTQVGWTPNNIDGPVRISPVMAPVG